VTDRAADLIVADAGPAVPARRHMTDDPFAMFSRPPRVAWTRGNGCLQLAELLSDGVPLSIGGDLPRACVERRVDLLVTRRLTNFDLVPTLVPHAFDETNVRAVTAAVADGPHTPLAAAVAARLGAALGVPAEVATVYRSADELPAAIQRLDGLGRPHPDIGRRAAHAPSAVHLIDTLSPETLLVVGAPEGSWFQRQLYGTGHRLLVSAPAGSVQVRSAPRRAFQAASDATGVAFGSHLTVADARRLVGHRTVPVADGGLLVGILRAAVLDGVPAHLTVADVMEPPVAAHSHHTLSEVEDLRAALDGGPIPIVDDAGYLLGIANHT